MTSESTLENSQKLNPETQQGLIKLAANGDKQAREQLIRDITPLIYRHARRLLRNDQDARDASQDTIVKILANLHRYDSHWRFTTWVLRICRNTCIDEFRRRKRQRPVDLNNTAEIADSRPGPAERTTIQRQRIRLHKALDTLAPLYKEVIVLYHFEHLQYNEIAEVLGAPIGTIMNRIFRARKKLREAYVKLHVGSADGAEQASATVGWNLFEQLGRDQLPTQAWATR